MRRRRRIKGADVDTVREMQRDLDYLKQFVVNVPVLLMGRRPSILVSCSGEVEALCRKCWDECIKAYERINGEKVKD